MAEYTRPPDLQILVRQDHARELTFEVHSDLLGFLGKQFGRLLLPEDLPTTVHNGVVSRLNALSDPISEDEQDRQRAQQHLDTIGKALFGMLPWELRRLLWSSQGQIETIQIVSDDEPDLMWELFKLQGEGGEEGPFLCEAFVVTRWLRDLPQIVHEFPLQRVAVVRPQNPWFPCATREKVDFHDLIEPGGVVDVNPTFSGVMDSLTRGEFDCWYFFGNTSTRGLDAGTDGFFLENGEWLSPEHLTAAKSNLRRHKPLFFMNACNSNRGGLSFAGPRGWAKRALAAGAGAFLGAHFTVGDQKARTFSQAVYQHLSAGLPIGEAVRQARLRVRGQFPGDPAWLAYVLYAHPAVVRPRPSQRSSPLSLSSIPQLLWRPEISPPAALLRAEIGIVPFHGREKECNDLYTWCTDGAPFRVRLYTGPGGMGKTRLALEFAKILRHQGWMAGFLQPQDDPLSEEALRALCRPGGKVLAIVDYAENRRKLLIPLLRGVNASRQGPFRLILLARAALDWWEQLKAEEDGVGDFVAGPATTRHSLLPLASSLQERSESYHLAEEAFAQRLGLPTTGEAPADLGQTYYERVLLLHMSALVAIRGEAAKGEDDVLDQILWRERAYLRERVLDRRLPESLVPGIRRAMAAITLSGGVASEAGAVAVLRSLRAFDGHTGDVLIEVAHLLHESYPGSQWIEPIMPDLLGEHLIQRELEQGAASELFTLTLGQTAGDSA